MKSCQQCGAFCHEVVRLAGDKIVMVQHLYFAHAGCCKASRLVDSFFPCTSLTIGMNTARPMRSSPRSRLCVMLQIQDLLSDQLCAVLIRPVCDAGWRQHVELRSLQALIWITQALAKLIVNANCALVIINLMVALALVYRLGCQ